MNIPRYMARLFFLLFLTWSPVMAQKNAATTLWYLHPARADATDDPFAWNDDPDWLQALPLGNGSLGAMVYGDVFTERLQLNEKSLWSGSREDPNNPAAASTLSEIRHLLFEGKYKEAQELTNSNMICRGAGSGHGQGSRKPYGCFQTLGDLRIAFPDKGYYSNYRRELDLNNGIIRVCYTIGKIQYLREYFISYPDQVLVVRFSSSKAGQLNFDCMLNRPEEFTTRVVSNTLVMSGTLDNGYGGPGMSYTTRLGAKTKNGRIEFSDTSLNIRGADEVILVLAATTDYKDTTDFTRERVNKALAATYKELLKKHTNDYQTLFRRVSFRITQKNHPNIPTDEALIRARSTGDYRRLSELLFQYGRYLLISSSRPGSLPANLQGLWANKIQTPWNADYHTNINLQMNYWPADVTNLSELNEPFFRLLQSLVEPGSRTARTHYQAPGWIVHPITNVWGFTAPGEEAGWGLHPAAGAWLCTHILEHFRFTTDTTFLREFFPTLRSSVQFYLHWLVQDPYSEQYVSGPAASPENTFIAPDSSRCQITMGPAHDQQIITTLFDDFLTASAILENHDPLADSVRLVRNRMAPTTIASDGRLMEWPEEFAEAEPGHRHLSHLWGLYPGSLLCPDRAPELARAAQKSVDYRIQHGSGHTGWSAAWLINLYARLGNGNQAVNFLQSILEKATAPNLFTLHPPFQIDANFGATAGIAEMLLQSQGDTLRLLPALPESWPCGEVRGLKARGGITADIKWTNHRLQKARITASRPGKFVVSSPHQTWNILPDKHSRIIIKQSKIK